MGSPSIPLAPDRNPWEQQPGESDLQYSRFRVYLELGPECDRLRSSLEVLNGTGEKLTYGALKGVVSQFRWMPRAAAWDRYQRHADRNRMIKRRRRAIDEQCRASQALRLKAIDALSQLDIADLKPADIARFIELSHKIDMSVFAEYLGADTSTGQETDARTPTEDIETWSPEQRSRRLEALRVELVKRASRAADDDEVVA
jgi:hypothetical protein